MGYRTNVIVNMFVLVIFIGYGELFAKNRIYVNVPPFTKYLDGKTTLSITGNYKSCDWRPGCLPLSEFSKDHNAYYVDLDLEPGVELEFKITRGSSWEAEAADYEGNPLSNHRVKFQKSDQAHLVTIVNWKDNLLYEEGSLLEFESPKSGFQPGKNPRSLFIWLPPGYSKSKIGGYPLLIAQDGENIFNTHVSLKSRDHQNKATTHSPGGTNWQLDSTLPYLIKSGEIPPVIVVGISSYGSYERRKEYVPGSQNGEDYINFLIHEVIPFVEYDLGFNTSKDRQKRFLMGSSLGGLISLGILSEYPDLFGGAAALSLAGQSEIFAKLLKDQFLKNSFKKGVGGKDFLRSSVYVDHGLLRNDRFYMDLSNDTVATILGLPFVNSLYKRYPLADHQEDHWARNVDSALKFLLKTE